MNPLVTPRARRHRGGANKVVWAGEDRVVSAGADGTIRTLQIEGPGAKA